MPYFHSDEMSETMTKSCYSGNPSKSIKYTWVGGGKPIGKLKWFKLLLSSSPCHESRVHGSHRFQFLGFILAPEYGCFFCGMKHDTCVVNHFVPFPKGWTVLGTHTGFHPLCFGIECSNVVLNESFLDIWGHSQELLEIAFHMFGES